jgi:hypothetical protein
MPRLCCSPLPCLRKYIPAAVRPTEVSVEHPKLVRPKEEGAKQRGGEYGVEEQEIQAGWQAFVALSTCLPVPAVNEGGLDGGNLTQPTLGPRLRASTTRMSPDTY